MSATNTHLPASVLRDLAFVGAALSRERRRQGMTQIVAAERALVSRATISRIERGDPGVMHGAVLSLAWVLGVPSSAGELRAHESGLRAQALPRPDDGDLDQ